MMYCRSCHCQRIAPCESRHCYIGRLDHLNELHSAGVIQYADTKVLIRILKYGLRRRKNGQKPRARIDENGTVVILS